MNSSAAAVRIVAVAVVGIGRVAVMRIVAYPDCTVAVVFRGRRRDGVGRIIGRNAVVCGLFVGRRHIDGKQFGGAGRAFAAAGIFARQSVAPRQGLSVSHGMGDRHFDYRNADCAEHEVDHAYFREQRQTEHRRHEHIGDYFAFGVFDEAYRSAYYEHQRAYPYSAEEIAHPFVFAH